MKEHPIIFKGPMVKAILEGRKTMTRRPIKLRDTYEDCCWCHGKGYEYIDCQNELSGYDYRLPCRCMMPRCPYGQPGDRLWVRETYLLNHERDIVWYKADGGPPAGNWDTRWQPSIFMSRKYSRITLEITNIKIERVQEITEEDAAREGVDWYAIENKLCNVGRCQQAFQRLWDSINGKKYPWSSNPWVRVIEFKREVPE